MMHVRFVVIVINGALLPISPYDLDFPMRPSFAATGTWIRVHFFRLWTALAVLGVFGYLWLNRPEYLVWWKRSVNAVIERGCEALPYPWGAQIESTIGNFGIWVQLTFAILIFRACIGLLLLLIRTTVRRSASNP